MAAKRKVFDVYLIQYDNKGRNAIAKMEIATFYSQGHLDTYMVSLFNGLSKSESKIFSYMYKERFV